MYSKGWPYLFFGFIFVAFSGVALFFVMLEVTVLGGPIQAFENGQPWFVRMMIYLCFAAIGIYLWEQGHGLKEA